MTSADDRYDETVTEEERASLDKLDAILAILRELDTRVGNFEAYALFETEGIWSTSYIWEAWKRIWKVHRESWKDKCRSCL